MSRISFIGHHQFTPSDELLFDTNIWLSLFDCRSAPQQRDDSQAIHAGAFRRAREKQSRLWTHPFVISEFANRLLRDEHNFLKSLGEAPSDYKTWRRSSEFRNYAADVAGSTRDFTDICTLIEDNFDAHALAQCLDTFENDARDLNDEFLLAICRRHNLTLVTNDGDFAHSDIPILTANQNYLRR